MTQVPYKTMSSKQKSPVVAGIISYDITGRRKVPPCPKKSQVAVAGDYDASFTLSDQ